MKAADLSGERVLVAGAGVSGLSAAAALVELGARVTVTDAVPAKLTDLPPGAEAGEEAEPIPAGTALVVTSPGRRPGHPLVAEAAAAGIPLVGEPELAWWIGQDRETPPVWLAVTGTNGKTTTVGMLAAILRAAGRDAVACGNIGYPVVDAVRAGHPVLAVELSSFQLHWSPSIRPAAGCVLNVADDHLDWHGSFAAYAAAKARVLLADVAVAGVDDPAAAALLAEASAPCRVGSRWGSRAPTSSGSSTGCSWTGRSAAASWSRPRPCTPRARRASRTPSRPPRSPAQPVSGPDAVRAGIDDFRPGPHRGGVVATVGGVGFVDDSKATNPHAAAASLVAQGAAPVVWIVGGLLKGASVDDLVARHSGRLRAAVVIGTDRADVVAALARHAPRIPVVEVEAGDDGPMTIAVQRAAALARPGDVVLLAPAAASMDQFRDYADRGMAFAEAAAALGEPS